MGKNSISITFETVKFLTILLPTREIEKIGEKVAVSAM